MKMACFGLGSPDAAFSPHITYYNRWSAGRREKRASVQFFAAKRKKTAPTYEGGGRPDLPTQGV